MAFDYENNVGGLLQIHSSGAQEYMMHQVPDDMVDRIMLGTPYN